MSATLQDDLAIPAPPGGRVPRVLKPMTLRLRRARPALARQVPVAACAGLVLAWMFGVAAGL